MSTITTLHMCYIHKDWLCGHVLLVFKKNHLTARKSASHFHPKTKKV